MLNFRTKSTPVSSRTKQLDEFLDEILTANIRPLKLLCCPLSFHQKEGWELCLVQDYRKSMR